MSHMCQILINDQTDPRVLEIVMDGLDKILKVGKMLAAAHDGNNPYALMVEVCWSPWRRPGEQRHDVDNT